MPENNKLQSTEFEYCGTIFCLMRQSVSCHDYILYMEDHGKWAEMNKQGYCADGDLETLKMIDDISNRILQLDEWLPDSSMPSKPFAYHEEGHIYTFQHQKNAQSIDVEASGFDDASSIMFSNGEYDPNDWKLVLIDQRAITHA